MNGTMQKKVAIVDYGMGNIFSVKRACDQVGLLGFLTADPGEISSADAVILPGVGAFGNAMQMLQNLNLVNALQKAAIEKPFMGICLGLQLLMTKSHEFGLHAGLGILSGEVLRLKNGLDCPLALKVPQIGWNRIVKEQKNFDDSLLKGLADGDYLYFVHSYFVKPEEEEVILTSTRYGSNVFCSSVQRENLFACQFHPERSGPKGLQIYRNFAERCSG